MMAPADVNSAWHCVAISDAEEVMRVGFVNCRHSRFAALAAKSNKTVTMEN